MPCNLQTKVPGVKSVISKASNSKADVLIEAGDKIHIGDLFLEVGLLFPFDLFICFVQLNNGNDLGIIIL